MKPELMSFGLSPSEVVGEMLPYSREWEATAMISRPTVNFMLRAGVGLATVAALPVLLSAGQAIGGSAASTRPVTYAKDIAPILQRVCQDCHRPESIAPMSLLTYEEARPWARSIKDRTSRGTRLGTMPPWFVDKTIGIQKYKNDPSLSAEEIATIAAWVDNGAPEGNPADMPPPRKFDLKEGWRIGKPDLIVDGPVVSMLAVGGDWWGSSLPGDIPINIAEDRYVSAIQMREVTDSMDGGSDRRSIGGRFIIHHMGFNVVGPSSDGSNITSEGEGRTVGAVGGLHEVGRNEDVYDPRAGRLLKKGSVGRIGITHLHSNGKNTKAHLQIAFKFHPKGYVPTKVIRRQGLFGGSMNLDIASMKADQKFEAFTVLQDNAKIMSFEPHMHAAGVRMCMDAINGATMTIETLSCVGYDHSWVRIYTYADDAAPLLPRGTILRITGTFDNTPANRNVADPRNWSGLGHRSIDNMMNQLGETQLLTDEEFREEMVKRVKALGLKEGQSVLGCPLCGTVKVATMTTGQN